MYYGPNSVWLRCKITAHTTLYTHTHIVVVVVVGLSPAQTVYLNFLHLVEMERKKSADKLRAPLLMGGDFILFLFFSPNLLLCIDIDIGYRRWVCENKIRAFNNLNVNLFALDGIDACLRLRMVQVL